MTLPAITNSVLQSKFEKALKKLQAKKVVKTKEEFMVNALNWYIDNLYKEKVITP